MLPEMPAELKEAQALGISLFAGEAEEHRLDQVLRDAWRGEMKPLYNFMDKLPSLEGEPAPILPRKHLARTTGHYSSIDLGRGCPYQCSFCTIINVQGRKSRFRTPDDLEQIIRENRKQGIDRFFITDDNFARNSDWEILLDRVIKLQEEGIHCGFTIQVDTLCHKIPNFIEKATKAGARRIFIGLENINPENLITAKKRQNKITEYRVMLQKWRAHGALTFAGYILGFPADTKESILRDIEIIKRELPLDILEFFFLTPLPGSEDHKTLLKKGVWMDPDINKYDLDHRVAHHPKMTDQEWEDAYRAAWATLLHARPHSHDPEAGGADPERPAETDHEHDHVVQADDRAGGRASARRRRFPPQIPPRPPTQPAAGIAARLLSALLGRDRGQGLALFAVLLEDAAHPQRGSERSRPLYVHRPRNRAAKGRRVRAAVALSRHQRRRSGARAQGARRQHSRFRARACHRGIRDRGGMI